MTAANDPSAARPVVLVPACNRPLGAQTYHVVGAKYIDAVRLAGGLPLVLPWLAADDLEAVLERVDGVLLTGSPSNVHPRHYGEAVQDERLPLDPRRDDSTLALIPRALQRGLPLFAICRGFQETNVALGGTLHQAVHEQPGLMDHRDGGDALPFEQQYAPAHPVQVQPGGRLAALLGGPGPISVNSLHGQGVKQLAPGLQIEALAPDGLVEAFSVPGAAGFNLAVQWHPEWQAQHNPVSMKLLRAFGAACQEYRDTHRPPSPRAQ